MEGYLPFGGFFIHRKLQVSCFWAYSAGKAKGTLGAKAILIFQAGKLMSKPKWGSNNFTSDITKRP
jgi:hypothetical protein